MAHELQRDTPERAIVIRIGSDQSVTINSEATDMERLSTRLAEIFSSRGERAVFVQGDSDLEFQHVARAIDSAKAAGIHTIGLLSERL